MVNVLKTIKSKFENLLSKISEWMDKGNRTSVIFLSPYVIMFVIFIVLPVIVSMVLSLTYYNSISTPTFAGLDN